MVNEDSGTVSVCATILTPQERLSAPGYLIVFSIYTIPGTAESKLLELAELCMTWHLILLYAHTLLSLLPWLNNYTLTPLPIHTLTPLPLSPYTHSPHSPYTHSPHSPLSPYTHSPHTHHTHTHPLTPLAIHTFTPLTLLPIHPLTHSPLSPYTHSPPSTHIHPPPHIHTHPPPHTLTPLPIYTLTPLHTHSPPSAHTHPSPHIHTHSPLYTLTGQADYRGRTREEAIARPVLNGLVPNLPESCTDIEIVNDFDDSEGTEQLQLSLEFSTDNTNVNVEGCPANVTILDRRTYTSLSCTANCRQESTSSKNKNVKYCT